MTAQKRVSPRRRPIPLAVQVRVFFRDGWLCRWCHRPVVFAPAFRLLEVFVKEKKGYPHPVAYFHRNWSRRSAPLLDHLGAVIDHVDALAKGGAHSEDNFVTACNKCNARKNDGSARTFSEAHPDKPVRGKYGEPSDWDGLVSLFLLLGDDGAKLTATEQRWTRAFRKHYGS